jgi:hypothetical protein
MLLALANLAINLSAQQPIATPTLVRMEAGTCPRCTLTLERVAVVGSANDAELISDFATPAAPRPGQFFVGDWRGRQALLRYDARGHYVGTLGHLGDGPGEFRGVQAIEAARGDSIAIYRYPRLTVISTQSGRGRSLTHTTDIEAYRMLMLPDGSALVQNSGERAAAFVVVAPSGKTTRTFGPTAARIDMGDGRMFDAVAQQFVLALSPSGGFWAAAQNYHHWLEHWTNDGTSMLRIDRKPAWFAPYDHVAYAEYAHLGAGLVPPVSMTLGLWVDSAAHLFVVGRVADSRWHKDPAAKPPAPGQGHNPNDPMTGGIDRYYDGVLEVYNEKTGALLGSWRADVFPGAFTESGLLANRIEDADGVKSFVFWRPVFTVH